MHAYKHVLSVIYMYFCVCKYVHLFACIRMLTYTCVCLMVIYAHMHSNALYNFRVNIRHKTSPFLIYIA